MASISRTLSNANVTMRNSPPWYSIVIPKSDVYHWGFKEYVKATTIIKLKSYSHLIAGFRLIPKTAKISIGSYGGNASWYFYHTLCWADMAAWSIIPG